MMNFVIGVVGILALIASLRQIFVTLRAGSFRARGNRLIRRERHPIIFWINFSALMLVSVGATALIACAWLISI
jgi:hypothetical protein